jgi:hypothetical protein
MSRRSRPRAERQGDDRPEHRKELEDPTGGDAMRTRADESDDELPESGMGGTSDAGSAADDAAEAAAYGIGTKHDLTKPPQE